jgi:hypothetical protein
MNIVREHINEGVISPKEELDQMLTVFDDASFKDKLKKYAKNKDYRSFVQALNKVFKPFRIKFQSDNKFQSTGKAERITGFSEAICAIEDQEGEYKRGDIIVEINSEDMADVFLHPRREELFKKVFRTVIGHELIHRKQFSRMHGYTFNTEKEVEKYKVAQNVNRAPDEQLRKYYGDIHELMSLAYQTIEELKTYGYNIEKIKNILRNPWGMNVPEEHSDALSMYKRLYKDAVSKDRKAILKYWKYIYKYLDQTD